MRSRKLTIVLAAAAALALPVVFASPAAAAPLPAGDSLWSISCDADVALWSMSPDDAASTKIGPGVEGCAAQAAWNPITNTAYYILWTEDNHIASIDLTTGASTTVGEFAGPDVVTYPTSMAIGLDGAAYVWDRAGNFFSLNLGSGAATLIAATSFESFFSFSVDPTTGLFYAVDTDNDAYRIDVATGAATYLGTIAVGEGDDIYSLQIDTAGAWWVNSWIGGPGPAQIWYGAQPSGEAVVPFEFVGEFYDAADVENPIYSESLLISYPPKLAATGADHADLALGVAGGAMLLLAGGAILLTRRRATN